MERLNEWDLAAESYSEQERNSLYANFCREFVKNHFTNINHKKILDAGCGDGTLTHMLTQNGGNVVGCDGSFEMLRIYLKAKTFTKKLFKVFAFKQPTACAKSAFLFAL